MPITFQRVSFQDKFCQINVGLVTTLICQKPFWPISQQTWRAAAPEPWFCDPMLCHLPFPLFHPPTPSYGHMICMLSYRRSIPHICVMLGLVREGLSERRSEHRRHLCLSGREPILVGSGTQNSRSQSQVETSEGRHLWLVSVVHSLDFCKQSVVQGLIRRLTCNWVTMTTRDFNIKYSLPAWHFGCLGNKTWCSGHLSQLESKSITGSVMINKSRDKVLFIIYS